MSGYEGFAPIYDRWAADMVDDIDFYVDLAREADGPVIELAAGTGRISIPIAQQTGRRVDEPLRHLTTYAPGDSRVDITLEEGPNVSLSWIARSEWEGLLDDRRPFDDASREFVLVARKPAA